MTGFIRLSLTITSILVTVAFTDNIIAKTQTESKPAYDFKLKSNSGENVRLQDLIGQVVLINFWASWCGPCRKELPELETLHQRYKSFDVTILGINIDRNPELSKKLLKDYNLTFPILYDSENQVSELYEIESMPSTFLVDKNGLFRFRHNGYLAGYEKKYEQQIMQLLQE